LRNALESRSALGEYEDEEEEEGRAWQQLRLVPQPRAIAAQSLRCAAAVALGSSARLAAAETGARGGHGACSRGGFRGVFDAVEAQLCGPVGGSPRARRSRACCSGRAYSSAMEPEAGKCLLFSMVV